MFLKHIDIQNLRSIERATLEDCGRFNVLIGKNNSGKSNLLRAIGSVFATFEGGDVINLRTGLRLQTDFFDRKTSQNIIIQTAFQLDERDTIDLLSDLKTELPQITHAIESLAKNSFIHVEIKHVFEPTYSAVTRVALGKTELISAQEAVLFEIGNEAMGQLHSRAKRAVREREESKYYRAALDRIDGDSFNALKRERSGPTSTLRYILVSRISGRIPEAVISGVDQIFKKSESLLDFQQQIERRTSEIDEQLELLEKTPLTENVATIAGQQNTIPSFVLKLIGRLGRTKLIALQERRDPIGPEDAERLLALKVRRGGDKRFRSFQETASTLIGVDIDAFAADPSTKAEASPWRADTTQRAELDVDNFLAQANGSGVKEALRLLLDLELETPDVALVEEPEVHLHPALEASVMRYLKRKSQECQIFITTHSTNFIDTGDYSAIYVIRKDDKTSVSRINAEEAADVLPEELGLRLSSVFMFDKLVFVEGPSDEEIIKEWAQILGINLSQTGVGFVNIGGARNIHHFSANKTAEFLANRGVKLWFVVDRDEKSTEELQKLRASVSPNGQLCVLNVREIENYLVIPEVLEKFIATKEVTDGRKEGLPDATQIALAIDERAESLKTYTLAKYVLGPINRVLPLRPNVPIDCTTEDIKTSAKTAIEAAAHELGGLMAEVDRESEAITAEFERRWASSKTALVPGEELLDAILKKYGLRYKKQRDAKPIASLMRENQIPQEIAALLRDLAKE